MSSFGSSLINKGRKVVPKAAGRRRPGAAAALASQESASVTSARSSVEASQTPQPDLLQNQATPQLGTSTTEDLLPKAVVPESNDGPLAGTAASYQSSTVVPTRELTIPAVSSTAARRTASPVALASGPSKRRRIDAGSQDVPERGRLDDEIPVIQVSKRTPPRPSRSGRSTTEDQTEGQSDEDGLVRYETPAATSTPSGRQASQATLAPLHMTSVDGAKSRAKGTRRNQWQVTTQADLAPPGSRDETRAVEQTERTEGTDDDPITVVGPKARKVRKDKGIKRGPIPRRNQSAEVEEEAPVATRRTRSARSRANVEDAPGPRATRAKAVAPQPTPPPTAPTATAGSLDEASSEMETPEPSSISSRLRNAQKRRARQVATESARSRASSSRTATAIDAAISQSIEGQPVQLPPSQLNPLFRVQAQERGPRSRRSSSIVSDTTGITVLTENGTRKRKRYRRQATPPGNETVFIAEKVTPMISLVGRDTENRVGMRSTMELKMRDIDWKDVKQKNAEQFRQAAILKGKRKTNDFEVIFGRQETPFEARPDPEGEGGEGEDDDDESILEARILARERKFGKSAGIQLTIINGEHRMDDTAGHGQRESEDVDAQVAEAGERDADELIKPRFNVHTFITWKRREPEERIYQPNRWNEDETEKFYDALRCCGTDFGSMAEWFPHRIRSSIKRKFNREERINPDRINDTLNAHLMLSAGDGLGDDGTSWDIAQFHANGAGLDLKNPRDVEAQLAKERAEREKEIEAARQEYAAERANQKLAGVPSDNEDEEGDEEEDDDDDETEEGSEEDDEQKGDTIADVIRQVQQKKIEDKRKARDAAAKRGAEVDDDEGDDADDGSDDEDEGEDGGVVRTVEDDDDEEEYYDANEDENPPDWDED